MTEESIINMLIINSFNYHEFGDDQYKQSFTNWMNKLKDIKGFYSIEEACDYFLAQGEMQGGEKLTA